MAKVRSPNYPSLGLGEALELTRKVLAKDNRNKVSREAVGKHLGHESLSGPALSKIGALRAYGLLEGTGDELRVSDDAVSALMAPKDSPEQKAALLRLAAEPNLFKEIQKNFVGIPSEDNLRFWLIKREFSQDAAGNAAKSYIATMKLVGPVAAGYNLPTKQKEEEIKPAIPPKIGDFIQWTSAGADQFKSPRRVEWVSDDGTHLRVFGSLTGIPMEEATIVDPPKPSGAAKSANSAYAGTDGELNVLLTGNRLQITADVDREGLGRLKEILTRYEGILDLIDPPKSN
jgi:hypothetical protein